MQRLTTTAKRIAEHYELDKEGTPKLYTDIITFGIVMGEFGGKHEWTTPDYWLADNTEKSSEFSFENGLKVWANFKLNEFKSYQLNHLVMGR